MKKFITLLFTFLLLFSIKDFGQYSQVKPYVEGPFGTMVNTFSGALYYSRSDLFIPGRGLSLDITFHYNSSRIYYDWGYGHGWSFTYSMSYIKKGTAIEIVMGNGQNNRFSYNGSGYDPPIGVYDELTEYETGKYLLKTKKGMNYYFEDLTHEQVTKIEDRNGNTITMTYTGTELTTISDPSGRQLSLTWSGGHLVQITDPHTSPNRIITYTYSGNNLTQVTDQGSNSITYSYGSWYNMAGIIDKRSNNIVITWNSNKTVSEISCPVVGTSKTITYEETYFTTTVTDFVSTGNQVTKYFYNLDSKLDSIQLPLGYSISMVWDENNNLIKHKDPRGVTREYTYDAFGNMLSATDPGFGLKTYSYNSTFNLVESVNDERGHIVYSYDGNGNILSESYPDWSIITTFTYNSYGQKISSTDDNGHTTTYTYDLNGNISSIAAPVGTTNYVYDNIGNQIITIEPDSDSLTIEYDSFNRIISEKNHYGYGPQYIYDENGNSISIADANGNITSSIYDALNRRTDIITPKGNIHYILDESGNILSITDANGHTNLFAYDLMNRKISETDPEGNTTTYTFDQNDNVLQRFDANGNSTNYIYDNDNRLLNKTYLGNSESFSYDIYDNIITANNNDYTISFTYGKLHLLTNKTVNPLGKSISYSYDGVGNRLTMTDPDGGITNYHYNANNKIDTLLNPLNEKTVFTYDCCKLIRQDNANGTYTTYDYDHANRLHLLNNRNSLNNIISSYEYTYDNVGNRISMIDQNGGINYYKYDEMNQVDTVLYSDGGTEYFTYDNWGNRLQLEKDGIITNYTYNNADRILTEGLITYTFDNNGNMTSKNDAGNITSYVYDGENRLVQFIYSDGTSESYSYCPFGLRQSKTNKVGEKVYYFYDKNNAILEMDIFGQTITKYTTGLNVDEWLSFNKEGNSYFYIKSVLGSITGITDEIGTTIKTYDYSAFGSIRSETGFLNNPYCFSGREWDNNVASLYYYRARYYSADIGRFISKDPLGFYTLQDNVYRYCNNNPINKNDPSGLGGWWNCCKLNWACEGYIASCVILVAGCGTACLSTLIGNPAGLAICITCIENADKVAIGAAVTCGAALHYCKKALDEHCLGN